MKNIFIIDDEKNDIVKLLFVLDSYYNVYTEKNPIKAVEEMYRFKPDIILMSSEVIENFGSTLISFLKRDTILKKVPIILTGYNNYGEEERYLKMGVGDFITRPYNSSILKLRINNLISLTSLIEEKNKLSKTDQLTNIRNRRGFDEHLDSVWSECVENSTPLGLLIIDIDHFKKYNDTYGHANGDKCLVETTRTISKCIKAERNHFFARWGGEEFVVLLKNENINSTIRIAESIRESVERATIKIDNNKDTKITISIGVNNIIPNNEDGIGYFISSADDSLYRAKSLGRNKVVF